MKPNKLEQSILRAARAAHNFHLKMTGGSYLSYSHESFLQNFIACHIYKHEGLWVYVDASPKKIISDAMGAKIDTENSQPDTIRFDLVFWNKTKNRTTNSYSVKAILEIKECWDKAPVLQDIQKISNYLKEENNKDTKGYVLYYTDKERSNRDNEKIMLDRFRRVKDEASDAKLIDIIPKSLYTPRTGLGETDPWGFALYRCQPA